MYIVNILIYLYKNIVMKYEKNDRKFERNNYDRKHQSRRKNDGYKDGYKGEKRHDDRRFEKNTLNDNKKQFFNPSLDVIVSIVVKISDFENVVKTINSIKDVKFYNKKIVVSVDRATFSQSNYNKLISVFKNQHFIEFNFVKKANHKDNVFNLCKGFARYYLLLNAGIEVCQNSAEKMSLFLKENVRDYYAVSPTFYSENGDIIKSCKRFPNLADLFARFFKPSTYINSQHYLIYNMLERGDAGYLKIHSVSNPIMDCIMIDGSFVVKHKPLCNSYSSTFLNNLKLAKKIVSYNKKIVYFPLARVIKRDGEKETKPSIFESLKFFLTNGISLKYKPSH